MTKRTGQIRINRKALRELSDRVLSYRPRRGPRPNYAAALIVFRVAIDHAHYADYPQAGWELGVWDTSLNEIGALTGLEKRETERALQLLERQELMERGYRNPGKKRETRERTTWKLGKGALSLKVLHYHELIAMPNENPGKETLETREIGSKKYPFTSLTSENGRREREQQGLVPPHGDNGNPVVQVPDADLEIERVESEGKTKPAVTIKDRTLFRRMGEIQVGRSTTLEFIGKYGEARVKRHLEWVELEVEKGGVENPGGLLRDSFERDGVGYAFPNQIEDELGEDGKPNLLRSNEEAYHEHVPLF